MADENHKVSAAPQGRMANIEMLRILAMMMVEMLHYLSKGDLLPDLAGEVTVNGWLAWMLELLSIVAVDVYVLISGYFLVGSRFRSGRLLQLLCQVVFYAALIPAVLLACGIINISDLTVYKVLQYLLPTQMLHYWYVSAYVTMYLFAPIFGIAVKNMKKEQLQAVIVLLLVFFSLTKTVLPVRLDLDEKGYNAIWFFCLFLVAAYIRLYGIPFFSSGRKSLLCYFVSCGGLMAITVLLRLVYLHTGMLETMLTVAMDYNHLLVLLAAVSLFYTFYHWRIREGKLAALARKVGPYTLGVYLLHEHIELRYRWPVWLRASAEGNPAVFVGRCLGSVLLVFVVGILVDMVRGALFSAAGKLLRGTWPDRLLQRLDEKIAGN